MSDKVLIFPDNMRFQAYCNCILALAKRTVLLHKIGALSDKQIANDRAMKRMKKTIEDFENGCVSNYQIRYWYSH